MNPDGNSSSVEVSGDQAGERLDRVLVAALAGLTRSRIQALIRDGHVRSAGRTISDASVRVKPGDVFDIALPPAEPAELRPERLPLAVVFEDEHLVVIDKAAGLVVHPAAGHPSGTLVNALLAHCGDSLSGIGGVRRPGIVHRLDKDTTGLLVVAKTDQAHAALSAQFASHGQDGRLERRYLAFVWGCPELPAGRIDAPIGRSRTARTKMGIARGPMGRHAVTRYRVLEAYGSETRPDEAIVSLLELSLETGRTHQIRVHMAHIGHPLLGDPTYGTGFRSRAQRLGTAARAALQRLGRQALHAAVLGFEHPASRRKLRFESPLPADMAALKGALNRELKQLR